MFSSYYMSLAGRVSPNKMQESDVPVVVISPEDREQVERLAVAYATVESARSGDEYRAWENRSAEARGQITDSLSAALREFANPKPPKPDEPMGLGAVVEARCGCQAELRRFVRQGDVDPDDPWEAHCGWHVYADLDAVRVLSPGWEADQ